MGRITDPIRAFSLYLPTPGIDEDVQRGMTLRDYFAAQALPTVAQMLMHVSTVNPRSVGVNPNAAVVAEWCYAYATAMMEAREER
ncbi:MAG TPA: hypothetical protein VN903_36305 [Polyangia bacterium]|nr:hypothetical protein [Polyangia bacterium]